MFLSKKSVILPVLAVSLISSSAVGMQNLSKIELEQLEKNAIAKWEQDRKNKEAWAIWEEARKNGEIIRDNVELIAETALMAGCIKILGYCANQDSHNPASILFGKAFQIALTGLYYSDLNDYQHASKGLMYCCSGLLACTAYNSIF